MAKPVLTVRNWEKWQTYRKDRGQPPWIKVHRLLMRNFDWVTLTDAERGQLVAIWLLAADHDGAIPASPEIVQKLCYMHSEPDLQMFVDKGFLEGDAKATTNRQPDDADTTPQRQKQRRDREETEAEEECSLSLAQDARARGESRWNGFDPEETLQTLSRQTLGYSATIGECRKWSRGFFETTGNPDEFRKLARRFFDAVKSRAPTNPGAYISSVAANPREFVSGKVYKPTATAEPYLGRSAWTPPQYTAEQLASVAESVRRVKAAIKGDTDAERGRARLAAVEAEVKRGADADLLRAALAKEAGE